MKRRIGIGDIHGAILPLRQVIEKVKPTLDDEFYFLGDYVDGWNFTEETIDYLINFQRQWNSIFLLGNHDEWAKSFLHNGYAKRNWLNNGGNGTRNTLLDIISTDLEKVQEYRDFFNSLEPYWITEDNIGLVHGGYLSKKGLGHDLVQDYTWDRTLFERYALPSKKGPKPKKLQAHKEVFIGHTTTMVWKTDQPMNSHNLWNLDTGAGNSGRLTAMDLDTKEIWQSGLLTEFYDNTERT